jgi:hypothetical protein
MPAEPGARRVVIDEVGHGRPMPSRRFGDRCPLHHRTTSLGTVANDAEVPCSSGTCCRTSSQGAGSMFVTVFRRQPDPSSPAAPRFP